MIWKQNGKLLCWTQVKARAQHADERGTLVRAFSPPEAIYRARLFLKMTRSKKIWVTFLSSTPRLHSTKAGFVPAQSYNPNSPELSEANFTGLLIKQFYSCLYSAQMQTFPENRGFCVVKGKQGLKYKWIELLLQSHFAPTADVFFLIK